MPSIGQSHAGIVDPCVLSERRQRSRSDPDQERADKPKPSTARRARAKKNLFTDWPSYLSESPQSKRAYSRALPVLHVPWLIQSIFVAQVLFHRGRQLLSSTVEIAGAMRTNPQVSEITINSIGIMMTTRRMMKEA